MRSERFDETARAVALEAIGRAREAGVEAAEAHVVVGHEALTRFAVGEIHQNVAQEVATVRLRIVDSGRMATEIGRAHV